MRALRALRDRGLDLTNLRLHPDRGHDRGGFAWKGLASSGTVFISSTEFKAV